MNSRMLWMPVKIMGIFFITVLLIVIPVCCVFAPIAYLGSLFGNSFGTLRENFDRSYDSDFSDELDAFIHENRVSIDYNAMTGCVLYEAVDSPSECFESVNTDTGTMDPDYHDQELLDLKDKLYVGSYDDSYFRKIHVLGKYTVSKYEKTGEHEEKRLVEQTGSGPYAGPEFETVTVEDYGWVYYPEVQRGKCESSDTLACNIILEDEWVYPYQEISFSMIRNYGLNVDPETYEVSFNTNQVWQGDMLYAFSKGTVLEADSHQILLQIDANDVDLYARYESNDGWLEPLFEAGETVEATEVIGYSEGETKLSVYNSSDEYVNPALFALGSGYFPGLGVGTVIIGMEDFVPDFSDLKVWLGYSAGGINPYGDRWMGQCTWFAWGLFYQHYGFDPGFRGRGEDCAYEAYLHLKDQGWTFTESPTPGSIFSTTNFNHVGIVAGVIDEDTMIIVEGNFNHKNDTLEEFVSLPDWAMRTVSTHYYKKGVGYVFCNPPK